MHDEWREVQVRPSASALMGDGGSHIGEEGVTCCELAQPGCVHQRPGCEIDANLMGHWGPGPGIGDLGSHFFGLLAAIGIWAGTLATCNSIRD